MKEGGVVQRNKLDGMEDDDMGEGQFSFFLLLSNFYTNEAPSISASNCPGILHYDGRRSSGCKPSYDKCHDHCHVPTYLRV